MTTLLRAPAFREDSDADDEYERSEIMSPTLPTEFSASPTESDRLSAEQTPTFARDIISPRGKVIDWTAEQSADFVANICLDQYADKFVGMVPTVSVISIDGFLTVFQRNISPVMPLSLSSIPT
jgi:protein STE50